MTTINSFVATPASARASTILREQLAGNEIIVAPGVFDGLSARVAIAAGAKVLYATGAGMTASRLG